MGAGSSCQRLRVGTASLEIGEMRGYGAAPGMPRFMVSWSRLGFRERPSTGWLDGDCACDEAKSDVELGMLEEMTVALVPGTVVEVVSKSSERFVDCRCR